ncbi:hypothetical protein PsorP6_005373 [Peronosclerospora sorghi]|uniref:Uncharacterized protein n=1 Tax=Peronosclerospora sorghi TaxID=230839 RepID=A0ACC0W1I2_9STRA|nr:hypothetical protein PsorP6_005373 [Peronosclerospora sorghi]
MTDGRLCRGYHVQHCEVIWLDREQSHALVTPFGRNTTKACKFGNEDLPADELACKFHVTFSCNSALDQRLIFYDQFLDLIQEGNIGLMKAVDKYTLRQCAKTMLLSKYYLPVLKKSEKWYSSNEHAPCLIHKFWVLFTKSDKTCDKAVLNDIPLFRSSSGADSEGYSNNIFMNKIHEIFQRAQEQHHGPPPTSKPFLDKVPVKVWTQEMEKTENQRECVICLSDYEKDDTILSLPCGHTFHKGCGLRWLLEHNVCPTCRYQLPIQTEVSTSQSEQPMTSGTIAGTEPEQEPSMPDTTLSITGVRRQRPTETFRPREVRQRVNGAPVDDVVYLDFMLEQEADRFMKEELANSELVSHDDVPDLYGALDKTSASASMWRDPPLDMGTPRDECLFCASLEVFCLSRAHFYADLASRNSVVSMVSTELDRSAGLTGKIGKAASLTS